MTGEELFWMIVMIVILTLFGIYSIAYIYFESKNDDIDELIRRERNE